MWNRNTGSRLRTCAPARPACAQGTVSCLRARSIRRATRRTRSCSGCWTPANRCRFHCATQSFTTPGRRRRPRAELSARAGPTTSGRMDPYAPRLLDLGLCGMIGKGERAQAVKDAVVRNGGVYLCAIGGAGVLAAARIKSCEVIAFDHLGCESSSACMWKTFRSSSGSIPRRRPVRGGPQEVRRRSQSVNKSAV